MGKLPTETSTHFAIAGTDDREDIIDEMNEHQLLSNASPRNNDRAKKRSNKRPKNIDRFTMADVTSASLTPTSYGNKGKGKRRLHRLENVRYLLSFWDKEKDEDEVFEEEPLQTIFTQVVTDDDARKVWNEFAALSGEEQDDYLAFIEQSERRRKQWTNLGRACRVSNPAFRSDVIDTTVCDTASDASLELSANHCYQRIERHLRNALTKNHVPLGMLEKLEQELSSFFEKWPSSKYVSVLSSSYERLLLHALCQYLGLLSHNMEYRSFRHACLLTIFVFILHGNTGTSSTLAEWTVHIPNGYGAALEVARRHGISVRGDISIGHLQRQLFRMSSDTDDEKMQREITKRLQTDPLVNWVSRQYGLSRERKSVLPFKFDGKKTSENRAKSRVKRHHMDVNCVCKNVTAFSHETFGDHVYEVMNRQSDPSLVTMFNDPKWPCQWELYNCGQTAGPHRVDLNVVPCWEKGFTGKGVVITIVDDGLDYINRDLKQAFNPRASADLNDNRDNDGPLPNKKARGNDHGTKCGGEIAMRPNNNYCGVGVAYGATLGGIRFLDGVVTDTSEAAALVFNADYIDIYSCSWGPQDNGRTWEGPGRLASAALEVGANEGRGGLGSIYVWAAGNGGASGDDCGADGYTCSIYTIGIASVSDQGLSTFYTESCSCIMAVTLNGGPHHMPQEIVKYQPSHYLVTTDPYEGCVNTFSGTSSAAPLASGVLALVLQANPKLTWRDAQHLIVRTSKIPNPEEDGWAINGAGFHVHHKYGFGLLDAAKMVMAAQTWKNVAKQQRCEVKFPNSRRFLPSGGSMSYRGHTTACSDSENRVWKLEHVQIIMTYSTKCRGDVAIDLISPCGTRSQLMATRELDNSRDPVVEWPFMSVRNWGEDPRGVWTVEINDMKGTVFSCHREEMEETGVFVKEIRLVFWGTKQNDRTAKGCQSKKKMAEEVLEENNIKSDDLNLDPKDPIDIDERLDQEIINEEFVGEERERVDANDLKSADKMPAQDPREANRKVFKTAKQRSAPTDKEVSDLRQRLIAFLTEGEKERGEFSKDEVPLARNTRTWGR